MSRLVGFGLDRIAVGETRVNCDRGWAISAGMQTEVSLAAGQVMSWMDFGRMVAIEHESLPMWAGMIDTPWSGLLPATMTVYNPEYLLNIRTPDVPLKFTGTAGAIALQLIEAANAQEDLGMRAGEIEYDDPDRVENFDLRPFWEQLLALSQRSGMELRLRPARDSENKLAIYLDMKHRLGIDTGFLLHDGAGANMEVTGADIDGEIWNRVTGYGDQSSATARKQTPAQRDEASIARYRLRSRSVQFSGVTQDSTLLANTTVSLASTAWPVLKLTVNALDRGETFGALDLGNSLIVQASQLYLPGGRRGWRGEMRITAMQYLEAKRRVAMTLEASL
jgi:hypothetical protein